MAMSILFPLSNLPEKTTTERFDSSLVRVPLGPGSHLGPGPTWANLGALNPAPTWARPWVNFELCKVKGPYQ